MRVPRVRNKVIIVRVREIRIDLVNMGVVAYIRNNIIEVNVRVPRVRNKVIIVICVYQSARN